MTDSIDQPAAHRFFSAHCFNAAWGLIDNPSRTADENEQMLALAHASVWHWRQRPDCTPRNLSIGYWQLSRVYACIDHGERAGHYAELSLSVNPDDAPFYPGYAHEALARAAALVGDANRMQQHLHQARDFAAKVVDAEAQKMLLADLDTIMIRTA